MSATVKMQMVDRGQTRSFYLNFPAALADAMRVEKGEEFEWVLEDKNTVWLRRTNKITLRKPPIQPRKQP
jgi:hypothetical protein